jgi:hypothetical protein
MRPNLHLITERRSRRQRGRHRAAVRVRGALEAPAVSPPESQAQPQSEELASPTNALAAPTGTHHHMLGADIDVVRVREAGGPLDYASYGCECGYQFTAPVSTSVGCPHCGASQAW